MFPLVEVWPYAVLHGVGCSLLAAVLAVWVRRRPSFSRGAVALAVFTLGGLGLGILTAKTLPGTHGFAVLLTWSWTLGIVLPLACFGLATLLVRRFVWRGSWFALFGLVIAGVAYDAFVYEPRHFVVTHVRRAMPGLERPLRIALLADVQTDRPGAYELEVFRTVVAEAPELVLFAGDMIQARDRAAFGQAWAELRAIVHASGLTAPLGVWMVEGDSEWHRDWERELEGSGIELITPGHGPTRDDVDITGLSLEDSSDPLDLRRPSQKAHIVIGHRPDYALGNVDAELLLAGHTHGGQVQIPGFGPLVTLTQVPRSWAAGGVTAVDPDTALVVSRGIGMERGVAPRVRFACRPEIVIIDLVPAHW